MMDFSALEVSFYKEINRAISGFADEAVKNIIQAEDSNLKFLSNKEKELYTTFSSMKLSHEQLYALKRIIERASVGVVHSLFASIDGATHLSSEGKALEIVDWKTGVPITQGALHENFMFNLPDELA